jgi:hypothetical protein
VTELTLIYSRKNEELRAELEQLALDWEAVQPPVPEHIRFAAGKRIHARAGAIERELAALFQDQAQTVLQMVKCISPALPGYESRSAGTEPETDDHPQGPAPAHHSQTTGKRRVTKKKDSK